MSRHNDPEGTVTDWAEDLDDEDLSWLEPLPEADE